MQALTLTGKVDTDRAVTTRVCRAVAVAAAVAVPEGDTAINSKVVLRNGEDSEGDIFNNTGNAADGRADGKWGRLSLAVRTFRARTDKT